MPLIKPRTRGKQLAKHRTRLDRENNETLYANAHFLGESPEYVLNQLIDTVLARDKELLQWRAEHQGSFVRRTRAHGRNSSNGATRISLVRRSTRRDRCAVGVNRDAPHAGSIACARGAHVGRGDGAMGAWAFPISREDVFLD